jgi:hypothetical protein
MKQLPNSEYKDSLGIWMIHTVDEIQLLLLLGNGRKHIRGNVSYLVTWDVKEFTVGYSTEQLVQRCNSMQISRRVGNVPPRSIEVIIENIPLRCVTSAKLGTHMSIRLG